MDMPYDALRTFAEVARQGSFSRAAGVLCRSQSAVSLAVLKLEGVVGRRLLDRTTKRVAPDTMATTCPCARWSATIWRASG